MITTIGYIAATLSILGAYMVSSANPKVRFIVFSGWLLANCIDFYIFGIYFAQSYALIQFGLFIGSSIFGIARSYRQMNGITNQREFIDGIQKSNL